MQADARRTQTNICVRTTGKMHNRFRDRLVKDVSFLTENSSKTVIFFGKHHLLFGGHDTYNELVITVL